MLPEFRQYFVLSLQLLLGEIPSTVCENSRPPACGVKGGCGGLHSIDLFKCEESVIAGCDL